MLIKCIEWRATSCDYAYCVWKCILWEHTYFEVNSLDISCERIHAESIMQQNMFVVLLVNVFLFVCVPHIYNCSLGGDPFGIASIAAGGGAYCSSILQHFFSNGLVIAMRPINSNGRRNSNLTRQANDEDPRTWRPNPTTAQRPNTGPTWKHKSFRKYTDHVQNTLKQSAIQFYVLKSLL